MKTRDAAVAGAFYPGDPNQLSQDIKKYLNEAKVPKKYEEIDGVIAPHAGYIFSGPTAAYAYRAISHLKPKTVIVLSPSHREYFRGCHIFPGDSYATPLGKVQLNKALIKKVAENPKVEESSVGHNAEHALEVQLPFLQRIYDHEFQLVPIVIGDVTLEMLDSLAESLAELAKDEEFLVVASSDLSHFHSYELARKIDQEFLDLVASYDLKEIGEGFMEETLEACGITCIYTLMKYASLKGNAKCDILDYRNSGDTAGDRHRVVGYAAGVVYSL